MSVTEDYCSFELCKLLKEKGFDAPVNITYNQTGIIAAKWIDPSLDYINRGWMFPKATHQMAIKWLREVHNLHICIFIGEDSSCDADCNTVDIWHFWSYNVTNLCGDMVYDAYDKFDCVEYQSYEDAVEAAIIHCLTNLI